LAIYSKPRDGSGLVYTRNWTSAEGVGGSTAFCVRHAALPLKLSRRWPPEHQEVAATSEPDQRNGIGQAFLASIVASSDDAIVTKDLDGIIGTWNKNAERIFGYAADEAIGKPITIIVPPHLHDEEMAILARIRRGEHIDHFETVRRRKDGTLIDISLTISPVKDAMGTIVGASKIPRDITARKAAEVMLREQTRRLNTLNQLTRTIASDLDLERIVQRVTDMATSLTGAKFGAFFYNVGHRDG
jgi:PAS domain S-box-containing protein